MVRGKKRQRYKLNAERLSRELNIKINLDSWEDIWDFLEEHNEPEFVYVIGEADAHKIKIGKSKSPKQRLHQLQTGYPTKLYIWGFCRNISPLNEKEIHKKLKNYRLSGEWFELTNEVREVVEQIRNAGI